MRCFGAFTNFYSESLDLWEAASNGFSSLLELFAKALRPVPVPSPFSRNFPQISVGGVVNGGNTCIVSVILQEMAALPDYYDALLQASLEPGTSEGEKKFQLRKQLQVLLRQAVKDIRSGKTVIRDDICSITSLFVQLGWLQDSAPYWRRLLHQWAPTFFSLPVSDPFLFYEHLLSLFNENIPNDRSFALLSRTSDIAYRELFEQSPFLVRSESILWRIAEDVTSEMDLEETFKVQERVFTLKAIHVRETFTKGGNHVVVYRKEGDQWLCCNDERVTVVDALPTTNIYAVVYESYSSSTDS